MDAHDTGAGRQNWFKVMTGLVATCKGIRPYIQRKAKEFHQILMAKGMPPCTCVHVPSRKPNPYHDMANCAWAKELKNHHKTITLKWKHSDSRKWKDAVTGPWEVAKLSMPFPCPSTDKTDATGLVNLLEFCDHYKINTTNVRKLRKVRNFCAHLPNLELTEAEKANAFTCMKNILLDKQLRSDLDAQNALKTVKDLE